MLYVFGDFVLDTQCCELRCAGNLIKLEPLVFHVLAYLIQHRDRVVPKREILEQLWPQQFVSDWALTRCITEIRRALGCSGRRPQFVKTLYGNGYRFIAAVTERLSDLPGSTMPRNPAALHMLTRDGAEQAETALSFLPAGCDQDELQLDAEPRQVTLLYGYLANTTALAETLGPAAMHSLRRRLFDLALLEHAAGEEWWLGLTYWVVGSLHGLLGDFAPALAATALAQAIGTALDDLHVQSYAASATGWIEAMRGEGSAGIAACQQSLAWALDPVNLALAKGTLGYAYLEQGEASQAIPLLEQSAQQWGAFGQRAMHGWMLTYLAEAYLATGYLAAAQDLARQGVTIASEARCLFALGCAQRVLGRIAQANGMLADATTHLTEALYTFATLEARFEAGRTHLDLATVAHAQGHWPTTAAHLVQAQTVFQKLQVPTYVAWAAHYAREYGVSCTIDRRRQRSG